MKICKIYCIRLRSNKYVSPIFFPLSVKNACLRWYKFLICNRISEADYIQSIQQEIAKVVKMREDLDIDVLVHGEPEVGAALIWVKPSNVILCYDGS